MDQEYNNIPNSGNDAENTVPVPEEKTNTIPLQDGCSAEGAQTLAPSEEEKSSEAEETVTETSEEDEGIFGGNSDEQSVKDAPGVSGEQPDVTQTYGGVRTTYVQDPAQMPRTNPGYSGYSQNNVPNRPYGEPPKRNFNPYTGQPIGNPPPSGENDKPKKTRKKSRSGAVTVVLSVLVSLLLCSALIIGAVLSVSVDDNGKVSIFGISLRSGSEKDDESNPSLQSSKSEYDAMDYERSEPDGSITTAVENAAHSVVEISTEVVSTSFFYGEYIQSGAGSGVIIDAENGYVITCAHVISGASTVTVTLRDGKTYPAEIVGSDSQTDIAVIKIEAENLIEATVADSEDLVVGQTAIAIGNPLGTLGGTVSSGIVSALDREITIDGQEYSLLQIDTSINPGNSGGGLFDITGSLIGIVNAKSGGSDSSTTIEGLGFAIPVNDALKVADDLINQGYVGGRAYLGIQVYEYDGTQTNIDYSLYEYIYAGGYGVYFKEYQSGQKGDLLFGDKIIALDGNEVSARSEILSILADYSVGDTVTLTVSRLNSDMGRRQMVEVEVTLIEGVPAEE